MKYKVITSRRADSLTTKVNKAIADGWKAIGGHGVIETFHQNRFAGMQHKDTVIRYEYSQTLTKE